MFDLPFDLRQDASPGKWRQRKKKIKQKKGNKPNAGKDGNEPRLSHLAFHRGSK
jgi:hypothetical protein